MAEEAAIEQEEELLDYEEEEEAPADATAAKTGEAVKKGYVGIHSTGFRDFLLKPELLRAIVDCGFEHPSEGESHHIRAGGVVCPPPEPSVVSLLFFSARGSSHNESSSQWCRANEPRKLSNRTKIVAAPRGNCVTASRRRSRARTGRDDPRRAAASSVDLPSKTRESARLFVRDR